MNVQLKEDGTPATNGEGQEIVQPAPWEQEAGKDPAKDPKKPEDGWEDKNFKKLYYQTAGQLHATNKRLAQLEQKVGSGTPTPKIDRSKFDEDTIALATEIAQEQIEKLGLKPQGEQPDPIDQKELEVFLDKNPEAYVHLDDIHTYRQTYPKMSYAKIFRTFIMDENEVAIPKTRPLGSWDGAPSTKVEEKPATPPSKGTGKDPNEDAIEASFGKMKANLG